MPELVNPSVEANLRNAYRIDTGILLEYCALEDTEKPLASLFSTTRNHALQQSFDQASEGVKNGLIQLTRTDSNTAELFSNLNTKVDILARTLKSFIDLQCESSALTEANVSLSTTGFSFASPHQIVKDTQLGCHIVLLPAREEILCHTNVIRSEQINDRWEIAVEYIALDEHSERKLSRYILDHQIASNKRQQFP